MTHSAYGEWPTHYRQADRSDWQMIYDEWRRNRNTVGHGIGASSSGAGTLLSAGQGFSTDWDWPQNTFLGRIVKTGVLVDNPADPEGDLIPHPGFTDARYWVKQVIDVTPGDDTIGDATNMGFYDNFNRHLPGEPIDLEREDHLINTGLLVPAVNISELPEEVPAPPPATIGHTFEDGGTHRVPEGEIVRVHFTRSGSTRELYYFSRPVGTAIDFAIVVDDMSAPNADILEISPVRVIVPPPLPPGEPGPPEPIRYDVPTRINPETNVPEPVTMFVQCWPNTFARHFRGFQYRGPGLPSFVPIVPLMFIAGIWFAMQLPRWSTIEMPPGLRTTDCAPQRFPDAG